MTDRLQLQKIASWGTTLLIFFYGISPTFAQQELAPDEARIWVDSVYASLSLEEKIGQIFMVRAFSKGEQADINKITKLINDQKIGGICFFQGSPVKQVNLINQYQKLSKIPLLIAIDGEWGLGMRFPDASFSYPRQLMLGAIQDNNHIYEMGKDIAAHCKRIGIHINFAPVVDINNNQKNPVINDRSFGEDKYNVTAKAKAYIQGMQDNGVMACIKHFPGHGDTDVDSHYDLPVIKHSIERIRELELFPFQELSKSGVGAAMVAHLHIPAIDDRANRPTTLSRKAVTNILREELGFDGLIFTDAMDMKGVSKHFPAGIADAEALLAGNDVLLLSENVPKAVEIIKSYLSEGKIPMEQLEASVKRILRAKFQYVLASAQPLSEQNILEDINTKASVALKTKIIEAALTVAADQKNYLPLSTKKKNKYYSISIGRSTKSALQNRLDSYGAFTHFQTGKEVSTEFKQKIKKSIPKGKTIVIGLHEMTRFDNNKFGLTSSMIDFVRALDQTHQVILCVFGNPYSLKHFDGMKSVIMAYDGDELVQDLTAQLIFGAIPAVGKLPVTSSPNYKYGQGLLKSPSGTIGFGIPERVGMSSDTLFRIEKLVNYMVQEKAAPGCQVLIAKDGKIIYQKSFGFSDYSKKKAVTNQDLYDVASVTKIMATTLAMMALVDQKKISLQDTLGKFLFELDTLPMRKLKIIDILGHQAGLRSWIPFYKSTLYTHRKNTYAAPQYYSARLSPKHTIPVANNLFIRTDYIDSLWQAIYLSPVKEDPDYLYSDLGFYLLSKVIERASQRPVDILVDSLFYEPMGLNHTLFNPLQKIPLKQIIPSEHDKYWRHQILQGTVHDMGAAMLGGVAGHAGLFSNAYEIAVLGQMLLNGGYYNGIRYLESETIRTFTSRHPRSLRRGLGFDMKELHPNKGKNMSSYASDSAYGHQGFTGTVTYVDPVHNLIYVFLSNRTYPTAENGRLNSTGYRTKIQNLLYKAIL